MGLNVHEELRRAFELATLRSEAETIRTPRQWQAVARLKERCAAAQMRENALYEEHFLDRVSAARRRIIDAAGSKDAALKPSWGGTDRFNPVATLREAQRQVRASHQGRIARIEAFERRGLALIIERARHEDEARHIARQVFNRAAERRTGRERRRERPH